MVKTAKVLLITPNIKGMSEGINRVQPGLGIGYLGAVLREAGHEVHIRDTGLEGYHIKKRLDERMVIIGEPDEAIAAHISNLSPDVVGVSALFSNMMGHAHAIARIAKRVNPDILTVIGGNHVNNSARDYQFAVDNPGAGIPREFVDMQDGNIDFAFRGEAEYQFLEFVNRFANGEELAGIPGLIYRRNGLLSINPPSPHIKDLNSLPIPARDLMNMEGYFNIGLFHSSKPRSRRVLNVMASRGCPEECTFCTTPQVWGQKVRWRNPTSIYQEIKEGIETYGIGEVQFEDDTLTAHTDNLVELCDLIEPLGIPWCTPNGIRLDYHQTGNKQHETYKRMAGAGCYQVTLGCESGVQRVLDDIIHKNFRLEQIRPSVDSAKKAGLLVHTFWVVGFPGETREEMERTISFAAQIGADSYSVAILSPLPGTQIYHQVMRENLWWDGKRVVDDILYRNSLIKVDGFNSAQEFELWVDESNLKLNELSRKRDPERFKSHYKDNTSARFLLKQT